MEGGGQRSGRAFAGLLPTSLVRYLGRNTAVRFAEVLWGGIEYDDPSLIWTNSMRRRLFEHLCGHLRPFRRRANEDPRALFLYQPPPPIYNQELRGELWCHDLYLRTYCDTTRFPNWPVPDPLQFLRSILGHWTTRVDAEARGDECVSIEEAVKVLNLPGGGGDRGTWVTKDVRRAFYKAAREHHPDRSGARHRTTTLEGGEGLGGGLSSGVSGDEAINAFHKIHSAYVFLMGYCEDSEDSKDSEGGGGGGSDSGSGSGKLSDQDSLLRGNWRDLIITAQAVLYQCHAADLAPYKYPGFGLLVDILTDALVGGRDRSRGGGGGGGGGETKVGCEEGRDDIRSVSDFSSLGLGSLHVISLVASTAVGNAEELSRHGGNGVLHRIFSLLGTCGVVASAASDDDRSSANHLADKNKTMDGTGGAGSAGNAGEAGTCEQKVNG